MDSDRLTAAGFRTIQQWALGVVIVQAGDSYTRRERRVIGLSRLQGR